MPKEITKTHPALSASNKARQVQKKLNKQTLHYFLNLSVTAELERADFNNWNCFVPLPISWIYKQKVERSKTIATRKKKDNETQGHYKTFKEEDKQEQNRKPNPRKRKTK